MDNILTHEFGNQINRMGKKKPKMDSDKIDFIRLQLYPIIVG